MANEQKYRKLQQHLDKQAIGFPATKSGVELKILQHIFSPEEAEIATCLTYKPEPIQAIFNRAKHLASTQNEFMEKLECLRKKGGIESTNRNGERLYSNAPLVVGMYEYQNGKLTPEFIEIFDKYLNDKKFGVEFLSTKLPQMRTIPIAKSIQPQNNVSTYDEVANLITNSQGPFVITTCICRQKMGIMGNKCEITDRGETCLAIGDMALLSIDIGLGREIDKNEAMKILEQNQKDGLVLQPSNTEKAEFICSCCGCCCGMLRMQKTLPKPVDFWASNFHAAVNFDNCSGCGTCEKRCQVGAAKVSEESSIASVDLNRCIGCGVCVPTCPTGAISLQKKPKEVKPPETREELHEIIMSHKKGSLGKMKVTGKLIIDAISTGQTHLLK